MSIATTSDFEIAPARPLVTPLIVAAGCVALADWLFYGWQTGISLPLFLGVLGVVAIASNRVVVARRTRSIMTAVFVAGLVAAIEDVDFLSAVVSTLATALFVIVLTAPETSSWQKRLFEAVMVPLRGPFLLASDLFGTLRHMKAWTPEWLGSLVAWIVPLSIFAVFLTLFSSANPLIEHGLMRIDLRILFNLVSVPRLLFWLMVACLIWPLIRRRVPRKPARRTEPQAAAVATEASDLDYLLGVQAMSRSLILFNALFALQSVLDLTYLWGGANLPDGMSHAEYAHRGAYPLIATALLAAGFVLVAMRPGGPAAQSRLIRPLVVLWIGQNILLVISSILRLDLYIAAYSLTYLRLAAFIWMGLVAAGLLLILVQIVRRTSNSWLVSANAATLALVLYGCCFINAPRLIASYNLEHCREAGGTGPNLDVKYLASLGPQIMPAVGAHVKKVPALWSIAWDLWHDHQMQMRPGNWRAWGFGHGVCNDIWLTIRLYRWIPRTAAKASANMAHSILVVDDDPPIRDVVRFAFEKTGMTISIAQDGKEALRQFDRNVHDLVVLDIGMPEMDGLEVCRQIRKTADTPILFLSARDEEIDRILGLEIGGDDYVTKPFSPRELVARVNAILRRTRNTPPPAVAKTLSHGGLAIDADARTASFEAKPVSLTALEFSILRTLLARPGFVFTRELILDAAYAGNIHVADRTIDSHVRNIRAKMAAAGSDSVIETVHGVGFKLGRCEASR